MWQNKMDHQKTSCLQLREIDHDQVLEIEVLNAKSARKDRNPLEGNIFPKKRNQNAKPFAGKPHVRLKTS